MLSNVSSAWKDSMLHEVEFVDILARGIDVEDKHLENTGDMKTGRRNPPRTQVR